MIETLWAALAEVPGAVLVIVFLGGPTAAWIVFRALNASARQRPGAAMTGLLWVCASCRSANDASRDRCYRCGVAADVDGLEVIAPDVDPPSALRPVMSHGLDLGGRAPVAVGPGKAGTPAAGTGPQSGLAAGPDAGEAEAEAEPVPAGMPGPKTTRPRRTSATADAAKPGIKVPKPASARRPKVAAGQAPSPGDGDPAGPDSARSTPSSTS